MAKALGQFLDPVRLSEMQHPGKSLFVAIALALLGGCLMVPVTAHKTLVGSDGRVVYGADGHPVIVEDHLRELRVNWPASLCYLGSAVSMSWTLFLVVFGLVTLIQKRPQRGREPKGGSTVSKQPVAGGEPPSVR